MLLRSDLHISQVKFPLCGRCRQCKCTYKTPSFTHPHSGQSSTVRGVISCKTKNAISMLKCPRGLAHTVKTSRALKTEITEQRFAIHNDDVKSHVAVHFNRAHQHISTLRYTGSEAVKSPRGGGDVDALLLRRELFGIYTVASLTLRGLNEGFSIRPFLGAHFDVCQTICHHRSSEVFIMHEGY